MAEDLLQLLQFAAWHLVKVPPPLVHVVSAKLHLKASIVVVVEHAFVEMPMLLTHLKQVSGRQIYWGAITSRGAYVATDGLCRDD